MNSILLYTDDNIIGQSIYHYLTDNQKSITTLDLLALTNGICVPLTDTVIINVIHKDIAAATTVALLNSLQNHLMSCTSLVLIVQNELSSLCRELLNLDNILILHDKSPITDFAAIITPPLAPDNGQELCTQRMLSARERQILELIITCNNNKRIAALLDIDHKTVHSHKAHIMKKLGMHNSWSMHKMIANMYQC